MNNKNQNENKDLAEIILQTIAKKLSPEKIISKSELVLLLNDHKLKSMFSYAIDHIAKNQERKANKEKSKFYSLHKDQIAKIQQLQIKRDTLRNRFNEQKINLQKCSTERKEINEKIQNLLKKLKDFKKEEELTNIKLKLMSNAKAVLTSLTQRLDQFFLLGNYKYFNKVLHKENAISSVENLQEFLEINSSKFADLGLSQSDDSSIPGNKLPKYQNEDLSSVPNISQDNYFLFLQEKIKSIDTEFISEESDSDMKSSSQSTDEDYLTLCKNFQNEIQTKEKALSYRFKNRTEFHSELQKENDEIIKAYKIPSEHVKIINNFVLKKLREELEYDLKKVNNEIQSVSTCENIIPNFTMSSNTLTMIQYCKNLVKYFRKYKFRTDNFTIKHILPLGPTLEERFCEFLGSFKTEIAYFLKFNFSNLNFRSTERKIYSIKDFQYDTYNLSKAGIRTKYDVFNLFFKFYFNRNKLFQILQEKSKIERISSEHPLLSKLSEKTQSMKYFVETALKHIQQSQNELVRSANLNYTEFNSFLEKEYDMLVAIWSDIDYLCYDENLKKIK